MQYVLLRNARFGEMWQPGARLGAGEVLHASDRESECLALVPRPLDVERCVKTYLNREWQNDVRYWTESVAAAEAYLRDPQEDGREIDLGDPHEVLRKGRRFLERHATRPETLLAHQEMGAWPALRRSKDEVIASPA